MKIADTMLPNTNDTNDQSRKKWQKPDFYLIDSNYVNGGGVKTNYHEGIETNTVDHLFTFTAGGVPSAYAGIPQARWNDYVS